ncbi:CAP domain-containing protein [Taklimakanibacter deserti]|uniref:CAP domain-containing protein n=1 Tax=Taklimakanibacter deserti TaxID=2267839 RepID=UPI000E658D30
MSMLSSRKHVIRLVALLLLAAASILPAGQTAQASSDYAYYARALLSKLPENAGARPDLEEYLDKLVSSYRQSKGRKGLIASDLMREAARAQAADMMFTGKSNHRSRSGHSFDQRFGAYVEDVELYRAKGENAASDRKKGPADESKARALFALWLASGGHRRNLMKRDYDYVSTGVIQRGDELWAVQMFWSKPAPPNSNPLIIGVE